MDSTNSSISPLPTNSLGLHEPFLRRAAEGNEDNDGDLGLAAFLTLRLADQFCFGATGPCREALEYQCSATKKFVADIRPQSQNTAMLNDLVWVTEVALESDEPRLLFPPLLAFAYCLEKEPSLDEAIDVLETAFRLSDGRDGAEEVAAMLQKARILRVSGKLAEARSSYEAGGAMAFRLGDKHSELLSRIGRGVVERLIGNLPDSEHILRTAITDACHYKDTDAEARACHDLAGTLHFAGRPREAVPLTFRAYELYESPLQRAKALSDTGAILKELGHYSAAKDALSLVLANELPPDERARADLEHLDLAAVTGNRLSFERIRQSLAAQKGVLLPEVQLDFELKLGAGLSQFEEHEQAEAHLRRAIALANQFGMAERIFHAEQQLAEALERRTETPTQVPANLKANADGFRPLQETVERLEYLAAAELG